VTASVSTSEAVSTAASTALAFIPIGDPLTVGDPSTDLSALEFAGVAVTARFTGARSGEVLIAVEQAVADALQNSPLGALDLAAALGPGLEAAAGSVGKVTMSPGTALDPQVALGALLAKPDACYIPLLHEGAVRAVFAMTVSETATPTDGPVAPNYPTKEEQAQKTAAAAALAAAEAAMAAPAATSAFVPRTIPHGLELLRDVAMEVTAQIGSTRMTVSELLSLTDGAVIELDRAAGAPADLLVNGHLIARGEVVVIDENFGLRITEIVSSEELASSRN
jgi:flagellar motor switch protein FliN